MVSNTAAGTRHKIAIAFPLIATKWRFLRTAGEPQFAELIRNVTVTLGREVVLSCVVDNLAEYKVRKRQSIYARRTKLFNFPREIFVKLIIPLVWLREWLLITFDILIRF